MTRNISPDDQPACADELYDPDMWFPEPSGRAHRGKQIHLQIAIRDAVQAIGICATCPLQKACLEYSMESLETVHYGIYAGTLPYEREQAINSGDISNSEKWQRQIRALANQKGIPVLAIAKRERPKLLVSLKERASWQQGWDLSSQQDSF
jgi:hypothetical protein